MSDDIIPLRHSYALSMVERISELEAENERLRAEVGRLRNSVDTLTNMLSEQCDMSDRYALAANKAEAEIERLWAAGDEMVDAATRQQWSRLDVAVAAWQEARRG